MMPALVKFVQLGICLSLSPSPSPSPLPSPSRCLSLSLSLLLSLSLSLSPSLSLSLSLFLSFYLSLSLSLAFYLYLRVMYVLYTGPKPLDRVSIADIAEVYILRALSRKQGPLAEHRNEYAIVGRKPGTKRATTAP